MFQRPKTSSQLNKGTANAEADHQRLLQAQVIHEADLVVGVRRPGQTGDERVLGRRDTAWLALSLDLCEYRTDVAREGRVNSAGFENILSAIATLSR
jgi:hypothetical protein